MFRKKTESAERRSLTSTILGSAAQFHGDISSTENIDAHGAIDANAEIHGRLLVESGCRWKGNILADEVIVHGKVDGDIVARNRLELASGSSVTGDIRCPVIAMDVGAICEGQIHMQDASQVGKPPA